MLIQAPDIDLSHGWMILGIITGIVASIVGLFAARDWKRYQWDMDTYMMAFLSSFAIIGTTFALGASILGVTFASSSDKTIQDTFLAELSETYDVELTKETAMELLIPADEETRGSSALNTLVNGFGPSEVHYYKTMEILVEEKPTSVQLAWAGEWKLLNAETKEEIPTLD